MIRLILYPLAWLVLLAILWIAAPAHGHTDAELAEWQEGWEERWDAALARLDTRGALPATLMADLVEERYDMQTRHPCRSVIGTECPVVVRSSSSSVNRGMGGNVEQWRPLVAAYFPASQVERALCIMAHESGGNPNAKNPRSTAAGLFQFLQSTWDNMVPSSVTGGSYASGQVYQPEANVRSAAWLQANVGWTQWSPYKRGECRH